jgi:polyhydroxyalkanoate synthesis regulator phasin
MKTKSQYIAVAVLLTLPMLAQAGTHDPRVNTRQHHQQHRIAEGVRSGELTRGEAKDLRGDRRETRQKEQVYKSDGKLTHDERQDLRQDMRESSHEIHQEKHDGDSRS